MISDNQMDEFFNSRFRDYPSTVPEDMWERINEKKKRDRMVWLFFLRLFALVILSLTLVGGYFILNQKKSDSAIVKDNIKINQKPVIADSIKGNSSSLSASHYQMLVPQVNEVSNKAKQKGKPQIDYLDKFDHAKKNTQKASSKYNNMPNAQSGQSDPATPTDSNVVKENETEYKKDALSKKPFVKATAPLIKANTPDSSQNKDSKKSETKNKSNDRKWYLDLYASPDYPITHGYAQSKLSYTLGVRINRSFGQHFSVKTGIQYSQINLVGSDSSIGGAILHINRLDLPVLAGYSFGKADIKTTINGGVIFNLSSSVSPESAQGYFENNLGLSLYLGVNFETKINDKFSLFGEPYYRYQLTSMTVSSVPIIKFIDIVGINIGARYYFGNKHSGR